MPHNPGMNDISRIRECDQNGHSGGPYDNDPHRVECLLAGGQLALNFLNHLSL